MTSRYSTIPSSNQSQTCLRRRYQIHQKVLSLGDNFKIKDELGNDMFIVRSKLLSIGDNLILEDINGNGLMKIHQEIFHLHPTFHIMSAANSDSDRSLAHIKQKLTFLNKKFAIDSIYGQYTLEALDILAHSFILVQNGRSVANITKKYLTIGHTYSISIADDENQAFILALVIVINQVLFTFHWQTLTVLK